MAELARVEARVVEGGVLLDEAGGEDVRVVALLVVERHLLLDEHLAALGLLEHLVAVVEPLDVAQAHVLLRYALEAERLVEADRHFARLGYHFSYRYRIISIFSFAFRF